MINLICEKLLCVLSAKANEIILVIVVDVKWHSKQKVLKKIIIIHISAYLTDVKCVLANWNSHRRSLLPK